MNDLPRARRRRTTRLGVQLTEKLARILITVSGIGTIAAVGMIAVFLVWVVLPLFTGAEISEADERRVEVAPREAPARELLVDEFTSLAAIGRADGTFDAFSLADGMPLQASSLFDGADAAKPTASSFAGNGSDVAIGFADGRIRLGTIDFELSWPDAEELSEEILALPPGAKARWQGGVVEVTDEGRHRLQRLAVDMSDPLELDEPASILRLGHARVEGRATICAWLADGRLVYLDVRERENMFTGESELRTREYLLDRPGVAGLGVPDRLLVSGLGDNVFLVWDDGRLERLDVRDPDEAIVAEILDIVPSAASRLSAASFLVGGTTLVVGDTGGRIAAWFRIKPADAGTSDGSVLVEAHVLADAGPAVTSLAPSQRSRLLATGHADGSLRLYHVTSGVLLAESRAAESIVALRLAPKEDGLVGLTERGIVRWDMDPRHPEASLPALFTPVWYEGYEAPAHAWQSEGGTDDFEPKLGFWPLIFGTLKATLYSMLFGAPLALLAAVFTSEFLNRRARVTLKSAIEIMASLPSVVLGFLAALVIAPYVQSIVPAAMAVLVTVPVSLVGGAYLWQLLPQRLALRSSGWPKLACMGLTLPVGVGAAVVIGPLLERLAFAGDIELWLDGQAGTAAGGWAYLFFPLVLAVLVIFGGRIFGPWMRSRSEQWSRGRCALFDLARFAVVLGGGLLVAWGAGLFLDGLSLDPRGGFVGTYVQRNALIVGFVMGFAVIPIIYTLAEDALSSVPEHLRQASLGAGATPWQTAIRIVIPTATSGLFSAVMIGLGRAVGETMIMLMATGNTPIMEMNVFNGFRTLSANIAVELPEAVQNSTHYRTLFLAALVLFAMTFLTNTAAEMVRLRYRKRASQL